MRVGIVSLGLIGGSILKSLSENKDFEFYLVTRNENTLKQLNQYHASNDLNILKPCDIVFVCSPMCKVLEILDKLDNILSEKTIVSDVSSLKEFVTKKNYKYCLIPSHPMAGTEKSGFDASFSGLFQNAKWVITPYTDIKKDNIDILNNLIKEMGATPILADAKEHDKAVALISHMPLVLSQSLVKMVENNELAKQLAASGFKDMTRLALSNFQMAMDMVNMNNENINSAFQLLNSSKDNLLENYNINDLKHISDTRKEIYK